MVPDKDTWFKYPTETVNLVRQSDDQSFIVGRSALGQSDLGWLSDRSIGQSNVSSKQI